MIVVHTTMQIHLLEIRPGGRLWILPMKNEKTFRPDRIFSYFRVEWLPLAFVTLSGLIYNIGLLATPWFEGRLAQCLADILGGSETAAQMALLVLAYLLVTLLVQASRFIKRFYVRRFANNINRRMKGILYANLVRQSRASLEKEGAGELMTKAISDVDDCVEGMRKFTTEVFDTGVALLAGAMIIPAVYVFSGTDGMSAGPSLMFVSLPKVFAAMGKAGVFVGILFFVTAIFATLTSCISVLESIAANCMEIFHSGRKKTVLILSAIYLAMSAIVALGYSIFYFEVQLPNGSTGQLLDIMDYISNSVMMPFIALLSTILIGWILTPDYIINEMELNGEKFRRKKMYIIMIRYVAPVMMFILFLQSTGILS